MIYFDYTWDLDSERILLDEEFPLDGLGWKEGDYFKFVNINGRRMLIKADKLEMFIRGVKNEQI
jgi:hypothetical protein